MTTDEDTPQPEYCDCEGFHTGACELDAKFEALKREIRKKFEALRRRIGQLTRKNREPRKGTRSPSHR